jgi:hypothetical protein
MLGGAYDETPWLFIVWGIGWPSGLRPIATFVATLALMSDVERRRRDLLKRLKSTR